jgi:hypothetical protein
VRTLYELRFLAREAAPVPGCELLTLKAAFLSVIVTEGIRRAKLDGFNRQV